MEHLGGPLPQPWLQRGRSVIPQRGSASVAPTPTLVGGQGKAESWLYVSLWCLEEAEPEGRALRTLAHH
jgi:hypothetical protein